MKNVDHLFGDIAVLRAKLVRWARRYCPPAAAEDLAQETLARMYENRDRFAPDTNVEAWASTLLRHLVYDQSRRSARRREIPLEDDHRGEDNPERTVIARDELRRVAKHRYADVLILSGLGYSHREIAETLALSSWTAIRTQTFRARCELRSL